MPATLMRLAEDIGLKFNSVKSVRRVASRRPADRRQPGVSWTVHRVLADIENDEERFAATLTPPEGKTRWTADDASRGPARRQSLLFDADGLCPGLLQ
ncbi:DUF6192 family protein [Streptomyces niveus]|uniref:DUF6192 family protein n=1 Tax=Streptomyces niveus TaxID=193462 RepID=UPI0034416204